MMCPRDNVTVNKRPVELKYLQNCKNENYILLPVYRLFSVMLTKAVNSLRFDNKNDYFTSFPWNVISPE